jgi:hypothetical protein
MTDLRTTKCKTCKCWRNELDFYDNERKLKGCSVCRDNSKKYREANADKIIIAYGVAYNVILKERL